MGRTLAHRVLVVLLAGLVLTLSACAADANTAADAASEAGFLLGLWHGLITPITFVISLFSDGVGIYEIDNNGGWYDFGYVFGLSIAFSGTAGGGAAASRGRR